MIAFLLKGSFLALIFPIFQGPDEQTHYSTIQVYSQDLVEKRKKAPGIEYNPKDIASYNFSEEIIETAKINRFDEIKSQPENSLSFSNTSIGISENIIISNQWDRSPDPSKPIRIGKNNPLYYLLASKIDLLLFYFNTLERTYGMRLFSVFLGTGIVLIAYFIFKELGLSFRNSLLATILIAFQPMFSFTGIIINVDILLILFFSLFIYGAIRSLKFGLSWQQLLLLILCASGALLTKGPGLVLIVTIIPLIIYSVYVSHRFKTKSLFWGTILMSASLISIVLILTPTSYISTLANLSATSKFSSYGESVNKYLDKTARLSSITDTSASYWGNFGWLDTRISNTPLNIIRIVELIALFGIILCLLSKSKIEYLPEKKYIIFSLGIIILLQLAIRFYDWRIFDTTGKILLGTPGRYFLPNIIPHMILMVTGLGFFTQNKRQFDLLLKILAILMILLSLYSVFDVIIPRYYL